MPLINKRNIKNADVPWPNPFRLKESELIGEIEDLPIEIVTLALVETILQRPYLEKPLEELSISGVKGAFTWDNAKDNDDDFWWMIDKRDLDAFYERYTPNKLLERVKDIKKIRYKWGRKITI